MTKKVAQLCLFTMIFNYILCLVPFEVEAKTSSNLVKDRNVCGAQAYELAYANTDGSLTNKACYNTYQEAKGTMDASHEENSDNLVVLERQNSETEIIDAKYAILDLDKGKSNQNTNIFNNEVDNTTYTYINGNASYGAVDAPFLGLNFSNKRVKLKISGITGWLKEVEGGYDSYKIIPLSWVKSTTRYIVTKDTISHHMTSNILNASYSNHITLGPKPSMLNEGTYYSYDGIYFYTDLKAMIDDYRSGTSGRAVNANNPYYNYYLYLPHHTKTTYSGTDIDAYLKQLYEVLGYNYTMLYGSGYAFYNAQENYGTNALLMLSVARNESANGRSKYATVRNNLFGHNAYDSNPDSATLYSSIREGIETHGYKYMTYGYSFPSDYRFYGGHLGNKVMGANVKYASDPYWGEKAAANYYDFDSKNGLSDYNYYQLAVKSKSGTVYPASEPKLGEQYRISTKTSASKEPYYNYGRNGAPVVILEEVQGDSVDGNTTWYKIMSDTNVDQNHNYINYTASPKQKYNWEQNYVYVPAAYFTKVNQTEIKGPDSVTDYVEKYYTYETYMSGDVATPQVAKINQNNSKLYLDPSLNTMSGRTWNKDQYVVVFEKAYDENHSLKSYQVSATYKKGYKEWIDPASLSFVPMTYGKVRIYNGTYANVRVTPGGTTINSKNDGLASGTYVVVLDQQVVNGVTWIKIDYDGQYGWVVQKDADQEITLATSTVQNNPPIIYASDRTIPINSQFNPKEGVTAEDPEDGILTGEISYSGEVKTDVAGTYPITYKVTDRGGLTTTKTVQITVAGLQEKTGLFAYNALKSVSEDTFEVSGFLGVAGMDNSQQNDIHHYFILENALTKKEYRFSIDQWKTGYPYEMSNIDDDKPYNYNGGWFKGNINLSSVPQGDYIAYVEVTNGLYKSKVLYQNLVYGEMVRKAVGNNNRGYLFQMNYYTKSRPLDISIRDKGLLASSIPPTTDKMFNLFETISFQDNQLKIRGTSHNVGINYSANQTVTRKIVLENISTFERFESEVGSITNGDYVVDLKVSDGKDKTRAWFDGGIDISNLPKGTYAIYLVTSVDGFSDFGELKDLSYRDFNQTTSINGKTYSLKRVDSKRFRMELVVS